jgi:hypothetical protein
VRKDAKKEDRTIVNHFHGVSSSTSLPQKPGEMCADSPVGVSGKFWNFNRGCMSEEEATTLFKCPK